MPARKRDPDPQLARLLIAGFTFVAAAMAMAAGCNPRSSDHQSQRRREVAIRPSAVARPMPPRDDDSIRIATFNLKILGPKKLQNAEACGVLADVMRQFDIVAVQEIRSVDQTILQQLVDIVNQTVGRRAGWPL